MRNFTTLVVAIAAASIIQAHPGETQEEQQSELEGRSKYIASLENKSLLHCEKKLKKRDGSSPSELQIMARRRIEKVKVLRRNLNLQENGSYHKVKRQTPGGIAGFPPGGIGPFGAFEVPDVAKKGHKSNITIVNPSQADWALLGQNKTVILSPESIEGPFYVQGEQIRKNLKEGEKGIDLHLDIQVIDINTCEPLKNIGVEIWAANATGIYSGVISGMNGNPNDTTNLHHQALRGVQITDNNGAVEFQTIVPGHYFGRAVHIHIATHFDIIKHSNNTIAGGRTAHVGQLFLDQELIDQVAATSPYSLNLIERTKNAQDALLAASAANGSDPIIEYVLLGKDIKQGIFGWINFGVDSKKTLSMQPATLCTSEGCKVNPAAQDMLNGLTPPGLSKGGFPGGFSPKGGIPPKGEFPPKNGAPPKTRAPPKSRR